MDQRKTFDRELADLKEKMLEMSARAHDLVFKAIGAFDRSDSQAAVEVLAGDAAVDRLNQEINRRCIELIALRQPEASDLRFVLMAMKMATDLERIADHASNISEDVVYMVEGREVRHGGKN
jgi:phosphate transport system protein